MAAGLPSPPPPVLSVDQISQALLSRGPWVLEKGQLVLRLTLPHFAAVDQLVRSTLAIAQELDHHPEVCFGFNHIQICLFTHDAQGITHRDLACADRILQQLAS